MNCACKSETCSCATVSVDYSILMNLSLFLQFVAHSSHFIDHTRRHYSVCSGLLSSCSLLKIHAAERLSTYPQEEDLIKLTNEELNTQKAQMDIA